MGAVIQVLLVGLAIATGSAAGCSSSQVGPPPPSGTDGDVRVAFRLHIGAGVTLSTVQWVIHHPTLLSSDLTGSVDASRSQALQFVVGGLPTGPGYTITLMATTDAPNPIACGGTSTFEVRANSTSPVTLTLVCAAPSVDAGNSGSVAIEATTVLCPRLTALIANPSATQIGASIALAANAIGATDTGSGVSYSWAITGGTGAGSFSSTISASTVLTCTAAGAVTVTVTATSAADAGCPGSGASIALACEAPTATALAVSPGSHACALLSDGTAKCWGYNVAGQLGDGTVNTSPTPVSVLNLSGATAISAGNVHTCALLAGGTVACWGSQAALGNGTAGGLDDCGFPCSMKPVPVAGLSGVMAIAAGATHTCALLSGGTVQCWGDNGSGELGDGTRTTPLAPVNVSGLTGVVTALSLGDSHTCALLSNGTVQCWGYNYSGQLGNGVRGPDNCSGYPCSLKPVTVVGLNGVIAIGAGGSRTCALLSGGTAKCWGFNDAAGELGDGTTTSSSLPATVSNLSGATALAPGVYHTCALLSSGAVECWGNNSAGPGIGSLGAFCDPTTSTAPTPVGESSLAGATTLSAGGYDTCEIRSDGQVECCGRNALGQLGNGTLTDSATPVRVGL